MALSRRIPGRDEEWDVDAGRVEDEEWKVEETPTLRRGAGDREMAFSDSEAESVRVMFRCCLEAEDDDVEGVGSGLSDSEVSACGMGGRVYDDGGSDSADDSSMRLEWMKASESEESMREWRGRVETDSVSESSDW